MAADVQGPAALELGEYLALSRRREALAAGPPAGARLAELEEVAGRLHRLRDRLVQEVGEEEFTWSVALARHRAGSGG